MSKARYMHKVEGSEQCLNGHPAINLDITPWACGIPSCDYYQPAPQEELRNKLEAIIDKHTNEWKAGHNHLIVDQILEIITQANKQSKLEVLYKLKQKPPVDWLDAQHRLDEAIIELGGKDNETDNN